MKKGDMVLIKSKRMKGKIVYTHPSLQGRTIYLVEVNEYITESYFEDELEPSK